MKNRTSSKTLDSIKTLDDLAKLSNFSLMGTLNSDPDAQIDGDNHEPRQVFSGHFVPVKPTPIKDPEYVTHSKQLFSELGIDDSMAQMDDFVRVFSGDLSQVPQPMHNFGWACGYALSIYGTEYYQQCPFQTGNGYGDGRAISVLEAVINGQRWEMQLKGAGRTPYCRGADGRAVLRSSVREFLAQEHMHALGIPTSRSLSLYVSKTEKVNRPWYSDNSYSPDPDIMMLEAVAISTRVAPSFIRVGQLELFGRRARKNEHPKALEELEMIVLHLIDREYADINIEHSLTIAEKVVILAREFRERLTSLIANWVRVGYCQGNFNSDNCAAGGYTLDYGPFGFCDDFSPNFQPWTGGGDHFSFLNQPIAAEQNFHVFCTALVPLLTEQPECLQQLSDIRNDFAQVMQKQMDDMWAAKLGLDTFNPDLFNKLKKLMIKTSVDYTLFFRELSNLPDDLEQLKKSFYKNWGSNNKDDVEIKNSWTEWLIQWNLLINSRITNIDTPCYREELSLKMKQVNPKYTMREWFIAPAYKQALTGNYSIVRELQEIMTHPYAEQSNEVAKKHYQLKPINLFEVAGLSFYSCSS